MWKMKPFSFYSFIYLLNQKNKSRKVCFIYLNENLLKMMKNAFYFTLTVIFVLKIFNFCPDLFGHVAKRLDKKAKVNFKIYDVIN